MIRERLHFLAEGLSHKLLRKPKIFWATIYPTYMCNYHCKHCYGKYGETYGLRQNTDTTLDFNHIKFVVDKLKQYGCCYIALLGGEPLLHKDIKKIINLIRGHGMELSIITNGSLIKRKIEEIKKVSTLSFSIDGNEEINNFIRGKDAYSRSIEAIEIAKKYKINVHVNATIYKGSINNMDNLFDYAKKNSIYIGFCALMYQSYLNDKEKYLRPSDNDYRGFYTKVISLKKNGYPIMYSIEAYRTLLNWPDFDKVVISKNDPINLEKINFPDCFAGRNFMYITANGDVYPCSQLVESSIFSPKNIFKDGFEDAWHNAMNIPCKACTSIGFLEINLILALRYKVLCHMVSQTLKEFLYRLV